MGTLGGGVGGMGELNLKLGVLDCFSTGMISVGREFRPASEPPESRLAVCERLLDVRDNPVLELFLHPNKYRKYRQSQWFE